MERFDRLNQGARTAGIRRVLHLSAAASLLALAACAENGRVASASGTAAGPEAKYDYRGWDQYLGGGESSQFTALDQVTKANVGQLQVAWTYETGDGAPYRLNPIVVKGVMYLRAHNNALVALDAATGKELWRKATGTRVGARGMTYWESADGKDRRLLFVADGQLKAVSADTGEPAPGFGNAGGVDLREGLEGDISKVRPLHTDNPGRIFGNLIIMSLPAGAYEFESSPADIHAYDVRTGKLAWVFHVVPREGEFGSDTWPKGDRARYGGVHNWSESTIDQDAGVIYIPTGTPRYDFYGGNRAGDNLFGNCILAIDARTGKRLWHFQAIHHDLWDYDFSQAPKLMTITKDGKKIPVVVQASKQGFVYVLDRRDGKPVWPIEERPVPASDVPGEKISPTQPFPTWPKPFARQSFTEADINPHIPEADKAKVRELLKTSRNEGLFTPPSLRGTISMPGHNGGANWGSTAADPLRQRLYVVAKNLPTLDRLVLDKREQAMAAMPNSGGEVQPYKSPVNFLMQSNGLSALGPPWSTITAYDMNSGNILWQLPDGDVPELAAQGITDTGSHAPRGGPVATATGLLFIATATDRKLRARDADSGKVVWETDLPAASEGVPAVYEAGGRQFIVVPVGGEGGFSVKLGQEKPGPNQYVAYALPQGSGAGGAK